MRKFASEPPGTHHHWVEQVLPVRHTDHKDAPAADRATGRRGGDDTVELGESL
jgi:hypothetical protein